MSQPTEETYLVYATEVSEVLGFETCFVDSRFRNLRPVPVERAKKRLLHSS